MSIKMIAFDLVGTLIKGDAFREARDRLRFDVNQGWDEAEDAASFNTHFDYQAVFQTWLKINVTIPAKLHEQFRDYLVNHVTEYLYQESAKTLINLKGQGKKLGFVTNGSNDVERKMIEKILEGCGIEPNDCVIVTGQDVGGGKKSGKPFRRLVEIAAAQGIAPSEIIFVGDKPVDDYDCAQAAGLTPRLIHGREKRDFEITSLDILLTEI